MDSLLGECSGLSSSHNPFSNYSDAALKYINQVLMEDDLEDRACTIHDSTLHVAEQSFYDVLNNRDTTTSNQPFCHQIAPPEGQFGLQSEGEREEREKIQPSSDCGISDFEKGKALEGESRVAKGESPNGSLRGRKSFHQDEGNSEGRNNKHLAVHAEESLLHEMFDKVLLFNDETDESTSDGQAKGFKGGMSCGSTNKRLSKREAINMRSLLIQCMQAVASNDQRSADKLLKQIRQRASPLGDSSQRLANCFVDSLEARLAGTGSLIYKGLAAKMRSTSTDALKAYKLFITAFPFMKTSNYLTTQMVLELAEKATAIHIIQFGIMYGLQFPPLVQSLSTRPGGPPKLRVTGIDFPQPGFRPASLVEETGCRLTDYCRRFNVPFEYSAIVQKWETVNPEDIKIQEGEVLVVSICYQSHLLLDSTISESSPRDKVLSLIRRINPDMFIHGVVNGDYNSPFFVSRFREALFYYSAFFDMFDATVPRENQERRVYETVMCGKEILNIVACEGLERVERPETYKQWQVRTQRAGLEQVPLNQEVMKKVKAQVKSSYHKDFFVDEASQWMVQGWKGRVIMALSCWKPV